MTGLILGYFIACALFMAGVFVEEWATVRRHSLRRCLAVIICGTLALPYVLYQWERDHGR